MRRRVLVSLVMMSACVGTLAAQQGVRETPPLYRGPVTQVQGVFVTPIDGAPFTALVVIESKRPLPDGTMETRRTQTLVARDSRGRIRNEMHVLVPEGFKGTPPLIQAHLFDPATRISYMMNPMTMIARKQIVPPPRTSVAAPGSDTQDLGFSALNGMQAKGTRTTRTVPAQASGTGKEVKVVDEVWYSEQLHMNLLERHTDVRGGEQTVAILSFKTEEPDAALFEVPAGYKVVDLTPAENSPAAKINAGR